MIQTVAVYCTPPQIEVDWWLPNEFKGAKCQKLEDNKTFLTISLFFSHKNIILHEFFHVCKTFVNKNTISFSLPHLLFQLILYYLKIQQTFFILLFVEDSNTKTIIIIILKSKTMLFVVSKCACIFKTRHVFVTNNEWKRKFWK